MQLFDISITPPRSEMRAYSVYLSLFLKMKLLFLDNLLVCYIVFLQYNTCHTVQVKVM